MQLSMKLGVQVVSTKHFIALHREYEKFSDTGSSAVVHIMCRHIYCLSYTISIISDIIYYYTFRNI
jgi:hypothetical protein